MSTDCAICCTEDVKRWGIWSCGHAACWECALRVGQKCGMCRSDSKQIIIRDGSSTMPSSQQNLISVKGWDRVVTTNKHIANEITKLKSLCCQKCDWTGEHMSDFIKHLKNKHNLSLCRVCYKGRPQVFIHEHQLYATDKLEIHESFTQRHPDDPSNFKGHPTCRHCKYKAYDCADLYKHSTESHLSCLLCDGSAINNTQAMLIYKDSEKLCEHVKKHHFYCQECLSSAVQNNKHPSSVAFRSQIDLNIHISKTHKKALSSRGSSQTLVKDDPVPYKVPDDEIFTIIYSTGPTNNPKYEYFLMDEDQENQQDDVSQEEQETIMSIKPKYAIEFSDSQGMRICFDPTHNNQGIRCFVSDVECSAVIQTIIDEGKGTFKFKELRKRLQIPQNQISVVAKLKQLAKTCKVSFELKPDQQSQQQQQQQQQQKQPQMHERRPQQQKKKQVSEMTDEIEEEIGGLTGIYGEDEATGGITKIEEMTWQTRISIPQPGNSTKETTVIMKFWYPIGFPESPPIFEFETDNTCGVASSYSLLSHHLHNSLTESVLVDYVCGAGPVVFNCVEHVKDSFGEVLSVLMSSKGSSITETPIQEQAEAAHVDPVVKNIEIIEGPPFTDKKSKFVAYFAKISSHEDARQVIRQLRSCKKIASAAHPTMFAYRLTEGQRIREERDDDGESGAADKLLFFLQRANVLDYIVVVTRWYGGIHLGSDRFKYIINVAKELLQEHGIVPEPGKK